jgi:hypothetical protein
MYYCVHEYGRFSYIWTSRNLKKEYDKLTNNNIVSYFLSGLLLHILALTAEILLGCIMPGPVRHRFHFKAIICVNWSKIVTD